MLFNDAERFFAARGAQEVEVGPLGVEGVGDQVNVFLQVIYYQNPWQGVVLSTISG